MESCLRFYCIQRLNKSWTNQKEPDRLFDNEFFDHHFAVKVGSFDQLMEIKKRADERNYPTCGMNHNICYSLYMRDPNQMLVEIVADPDNELAINEGAAATARQHYLMWKNGDRSTNENDYPAVEYPLESSPLEDMARVIPADRKRT